MALFLLGHYQGILICKILNSFNRQAGNAELDTLVDRLMKFSKYF